MSHWTRALTIAAATVAALALAAPANAATYQVAGKQKAIDADAGVYTMSGGLIGRWVTTSSQQVAVEPYYESQGRRNFEAASTGVVTASAPTTHRGRCSSTSGYGRCTRPTIRSR